MYSTACQTKVWIKAQTTTCNTQSTKRRKSNHQLLNYRTVWKKNNKLNMNFSSSTRWWLYRTKDLMHFWYIHNLCESLSCDWSFISCICKWEMVNSTGEKCELHFLQKTQTCTHFRLCQISWPVWLKARHTLQTVGNTARKFPYHESIQQ